jgi:hypothetical protein
MFFGRPVVLAAKVSTSVLVSDDKTHTATYKLWSVRLYRFEAQCVLGQTLNNARRKVQLFIAAQRGFARASDGIRQGSFYQPGRDL